MTNAINQAKEIATKLHAGVVYGGGMNMLDQVRQTAELIEQNTILENKDAVVTAAWLHKCREIKRIADGQKPLSIYDVKKQFGTKVAQIVSELASEPDENPDFTKTQLWEDKTKWASTLSKEAQEILLAEKICNFETSCNKPNPKKEPAWHIDYFKTRMIMVEALKDVNPKLYTIARDLADKGTQIQQAKMLELPRAKTMDNDR